MRRVRTRDFTVTISLAKFWICKVFFWWCLSYKYCSTWEWALNCFDQMTLTCKYLATWTSVTVGPGHNVCFTPMAWRAYRFFTKISRHDVEIVTQLLKKWFSQIWNEITISTYLSKSVETLSYWHYIDINLQCFFRCHCMFFLD